MSYRKACNDDNEEGVHIYESYSSDNVPKTRELLPFLTDVIKQIQEKLDKVLIVAMVVIVLAFFIYSGTGQPMKIMENQQLPDQQNTELQHAKIKTGENLLKISQEVGENSKLAKMTGGESNSFRTQQETVKSNTQLSVNQLKKKVVVKQNLTAKYANHAKRNELFKQLAKGQHLQSLKLAKFNLIYPNLDNDEREILFQEEQSKLQKLYKLSQFNQELSICVVVHARILKKEYSHEYVLNSIFNQQYQKYSVVYIADGHADEQVLPIVKFLKEKDKKSRVTFVWNVERKGFLESAYSTIKTHCLKKSVTVLLDGNDELLGANVFRLVNTYYRRFELNFLYGNFIEFQDSHQQVELGFSSDYSSEEKANYGYRLVGQKFGSIKTFKTRMISFIKEKDLKEGKTRYYRHAGDYALFYPLLELSCGLVGYLPEYNYLYYDEEMDAEALQTQTSVGNAIKLKEHYRCFTEYK